MTSFAHLIFVCRTGTNFVQWYLFGEVVTAEEQNLLPDSVRQPGAHGTFFRDIFATEAKVLNGLSRLGWEAWNTTERFHRHGERIERTISLRRPVSGSVDHPDHRKA